MRRIHDIIQLCDPSAGIAITGITCRECVPFPLEDMWMYVRRRGTRDWILKYPAWDTRDDGSIVFRLDDQFPKEHGRYEGEIRIGDEVIGHVDIYVSRTRAVSGRGSALKPLTDWRPPAPEGVTDMYEPIVNFRAYLCDVLEKDGTVLPLGADDVATLCGVTLCRPAQLVIFDGYQREVIEWQCVNGQIEITRGHANTLPQRFPRGAEVRFEWTESNVTNAMQGC